MYRRINFVKASFSFFAAASFFAEGATAVHDAHVVRQATPIATSVGPPAPSITLSPDLTFPDPPPQPITCTAVTIPWFYNGPDSPITLLVTNVGVSQDAPAPPLSSTTSRRFTFTNDIRAVPTGAAEPSSITVIIASNIRPAALSYVWSPVNVPQGWYIFTASLAELGYSQNSDPIYVHTGSDTSCLPVITTSSSSTTSPTPTGSTSPISVPIGGSSSPLNIGTIIGVSIAAVALVAAVLIIWLFLYRRRKRSSVAGGGYADTVARRWNGLSSSDSRAGFMGTSGKRHKSSHSTGHRLRTDSVGNIMMTGSEEAVGAEKNSIHSKVTAEGGPFGDPVALPVLTHQSSRTRDSGIGRTYSASSSATNAYSVNEFAGPPARRPSVPDMVLGRRSFDSYPPISPSSPHALRNSTTLFGASEISRNHSLSTPGTHHTSGIARSPSSSSSQSPQPRTNNPSSDAAKHANRQSFGAHKRKPVPAYDASDEQTSHTPPVPSPIPPSPIPDHPSTNGIGTHYSTRSQVGQDQSQPDLVHKSSFGPGGVEGKPLHYLIPDMPMPLKD